MQLSRYDKACASGREGQAARMAMEFLLHAAKSVGATRLIDISHCHLVGSYHSGTADLQLLKTLVSAGARVRVPTTLNASSACLERSSPSPESDRLAASEVVALYREMGCDPQLTCAPYQLPVRPALGDNIAWAESNAVVFANSVLGARTNKTVQYLDLCAAITGRIPEYGLYLEEARRPTVEVICSQLPEETWTTPLACELLGLWLGYQLGTRVPLLRGCGRTPGEDILRGLGAAAASSGALSLFHMENVTPEAGTYNATPTERLHIDTAALEQIARPYRGTPGQEVSAICLGAPHYSLPQLRSLAREVSERSLSMKIPVYVTTSRYNRDQLNSELLLAELTSRGITVVVDTCSYYGRVIPHPGDCVLTDSAKWAYYGGGNLGLNTLLGTLGDCLASASTGSLQRGDDLPWL